MKKQIGRPRGPQKVSITGLVLPATRREMRRLAKKGTIGDLFERHFSPVLKKVSQADKCSEPA